MAYSKTAWVNGSTPAINATNLNKIEQGIYDAQDATKILTALKTVDGSGSGLDADNLDGKTWQQGIGATATSDLTLTSSWQDVPGCQIGLGPAGRYLVVATFDFEFDPASANDDWWTLQGEVVDVALGNPAGNNAIFRATSKFRATVGLSTVMIITSAGNSIKLRAEKINTGIAGAGSGTGSSKCRLNHTTIAAHWTAP